MKIFTKIVIAGCFVFLLTACSDYGKKTKKGHVEVYYKEGISEDMAQQTANFLYDIDRLASNDTTSTKSIQLLKKQDTVLFRMVADKKRLATINDGVFSTMANFLSDSLYDHAPVNVELTDNHFKTIHSIRYTKMDLNQVE
jgi:hypothetical protein